MFSHTLRRPRLSALRFQYSTKNNLHAPAAALKARAAEKRDHVRKLEATLGGVYRPSYMVGRCEAQQGGRKCSLEALLGEPPFESFDVRELGLKPAVRACVFLPEARFVGCRHAETTVPAESAIRCSRSHP